MGMTSQYRAFSLLLLISFNLLSWKTNAFSFPTEIKKQTQYNVEYKNSWFGNTRLYGEEESSSSSGVKEDEPENKESKEKVETEEKPIDILNSPAFLKRKVEVLKEDVKRLEMDIKDAKVKVEENKAEWSEKLERVDKEDTNMMERLQKQSKESEGKALVDVVRKLLGVLDNFDRAFASVTPTTEEDKEVESSYKIPYDDIYETFKRLGVEQVETVGKEFDYEFHQAVMQKQSDEYEEGIVCEELQSGWKVGDELVRPAMVSVSM